MNEDKVFEFKKDSDKGYIFEKLTEIVNQVLPNLKLQRKNKEVEYYNLIMSFDTETTSLNVKTKYGKELKMGYCYIWQVAIADWVIYGRHIEDFKIFTNIIALLFKTSLEKRIIIWVHNLEFDWAFIQKLFEWEDVFADQPHKPIYAITKEGLEFRCSYRLSGCSLDTIAKDYIKYHDVKKMVGDLDYDKIRHSSTPLSKEELQYCINDVLVINAYIREQMAFEYHDDITQIPYTKTGRIRNIIRSETIESEDTEIANTYRDLMKELTIEPEEYIALQGSFQGGHTHANAYYQGNDTLRDVSSYDISSSYPTIMTLYELPMSKGHYMIDITSEQVDALLYEKLSVLHVVFTDIQLKEDAPDAIISSSHCRRKNKAILDNGKIVKASMIEMWCTNVDLLSFKKFYNAKNIVIVEAWWYDKALLPRPIVYSILSLYSAKTKLKGVEGQEVTYNLKKSDINSVYGCIVTRIDHPELKYEESGEWNYEGVRIHNFFNNSIEGSIDAMTYLSEEVKGYNKSRKRFLFYPWGVFVTAYARQRLYDMIWELGIDFVYSDTDSAKFLHRNQHLDAVNRYNNEIDKRIEIVSEKQKIPREMFEPTDIEGKQHKLGIWDYEGTYKRFKTLGAKRYIDELYKPNKKGEVYEITCAGLSKSNGLKYLKSLKGDPIENFKEGLKVPADETGKLTRTYIDYTMEADITDYLGNTEHCIAYSGICLEPASFEITLSEDYVKFLRSLELFRCIPIV